jgi:hypothetical protein
MVWSRMHRGGDEVRPELGQPVDFHRALLDALVLQQPARQLGTRVFDFFAGIGLAHGQQHARFDVDQHRGHQQVFGRQFEVVFADLVDVDQILARDLGHRDVEDVEVLLADQVEQQVQRPLEGVEEYLEGVGRDVQIQRQLHHRLAVQAGQHLQLELFGDRVAGLGQGSHSLVW